MNVLIEIHEVVAFLALLCAIIFSWTATGRRVVNAVVALQFLLGIALAAVMGANHAELPPLIWVHMLVAIAILGCYGMAMRFGKRAGGASLALVLSIAGLVLVALNVWLGLHFAGMM